MGGARAGCAAVCGRRRRRQAATAAGGQQASFKQRVPVRPPAGPERGPSLFPFVPPIRPAGFVDPGPANLAALTEGVHSKEALELVREHLLGVMGPAAGRQFSSELIKMSKFQIAQVRHGRGAAPQGCQPRGRGRGPRRRGSGAPPKSVAGAQLR
jgi:hypothetical protein